MAHSGSIAVRHSQLPCQSNSYFPCHTIPLACFIKYAHLYPFLWLDILPSLTTSLACKFWNCKCYLAALVTSLSITLLLAGYVYSVVWKCLDALNYTSHNDQTMITCHVIYRYSGILIRKYLAKAISSASIKPYAPRMSIITVFI